MPAWHPMRPAAGRCAAPGRQPPRPTQLPPAGRLPLQVRAFDNDEVVHVDDSVDPVRDLDTIQVRGPPAARGDVAGVMVGCTACVSTAAERPACPSAPAPCSHCLPFTRVPFTPKMELCKKDLDYVARQEAEALKDVKKTPNMKLPLHFYSVFEKVSSAAAMRCRTCRCCGGMLSSL
jgi:hypothetical protein